MATFCRTALTLFVAVFLARAVHSAEPQFSPQALEVFEAKVRPLLSEQCYSCHGEKKQRGGLRLDSRNAILKGGDVGPVVDLAQPEKSSILQALTHAGDVKMPPKGKLPEESITLLRTWVKAGLPWPSSDRPKSTASTGADPAAKHWAFQPVREPQLPAVSDPGWVRNSLDAFILAALDARGLKPTPAADRRTLIRRVNFDLTGLPPTAAEVESFEKDTSPNAFEKVVERLLASPHYGERWARHWLDVARYADTKGYVFQEERRFPYAYTYRDYVIEALNNDLPYDRFILEQLAADRLPLGEEKTPLAAMGYLTLGRRFLNNSHDIIDDRIDVVTRGLLGLTVTCARCHDHKYDPIPMADYYSLYGVFASSTEPRDAPLLAAPEQNAAYKAYEAELKKREAAVEKYRADKLESYRKELRSPEENAKYLLSLRRPADEREKAIRAREFRGPLYRRWMAFIDRMLREREPVIVLWRALASVPTEEFDAQARMLLDGVRRNPRERALPADFLQGLLEKSPLTPEEAGKQFGQLLAEAATSSRPELASLRKALESPDAPANIQPSDLDALFSRADRNRFRDLQKQVDSWKANAAAPPRPMMLEDRPQPVEPRIFLRGNPANPGPGVPRQFLEVVAGKDRKPFREGSGRLEMARAIASSDNPLTARVLVNRVWGHYFGAGLVRTPSDFGVRSDPPTHPELLDFLAHRFMADGWSLKQLHRLIVLSNTYQQGCDAGPQALQLDPENRLLGRMTRRRLDLEALRDAMLSSSGALDPEVGGPPVDIVKAPFSSRRTIYGFIDRQNLPGMFRTFDFANPDTHAPQRLETTVPQQALFLMNSPFVMEQARRLASLPAVVAVSGPEAKVEALYQRVFARRPTPEETAMALGFLHDAAAGAKGWEEIAQVLLLSNEFAFLD